MFKRKKESVKETRKKFHWKRWVVLLLIGYFAVPIGYYLLPWSTKKSTVYACCPKVHKFLSLKGLRMMQRIDGLGVGTDCETVVDSSFKGEKTFGGLPVSYSFTPHILKNKSYVVGYSEKLKNPRWVAYRVFREDTFKIEKRPSFRVDVRTRAHVLPSDYKKSGYDRGHMAPNYSIARCYGRSGQRETFLMSNIIPQKPRVNRYIWRDLEKLIIKDYVKDYGEIWVMTGPVFKEPVKRLKSGVAIPSGFFKIIADKSGNKLRVQAFLIPAFIPPYSRLKPFLVSVDTIEELTQIDFFPNLSPSDQEKIESKVSRMWPWWGPLTLFD
jgi:endonuclease G